MPALCFFFVASEFMALVHMMPDLTQRGASILRVGLIGSAFWPGLPVLARVANRVIARLGHARAPRCAAARIGAPLAGARAEG